MLLPLSDDDVLNSGWAFVTITFILANIFVFFYFQDASQNEAFTYGWSVIPYEIVEGEDLVETQYKEADGQEVAIPQEPGPTPIYLTLLTAMFMHGGYLHLFSNLLYLWIFGDNVEHYVGSGVFILFYLLSGLAGTAAQIALDPTSVIPNLGASGAISGVLGAYIVLFPLNRVRVLFFYIIVSFPAIIVIGLWIAFQFIQGYGAIMAADQVLGGVAYGAHIGGFLFGLMAALIWRFTVGGKVPPTEGDKRVRRRQA